MQLESQVMQTLEKNVNNTWGEKGKAWLNNLPSIIDDLSQHWTLSHIKPVDNMSYNFVALAMQADKIPVVLKVSCDDQLILDEFKAHKHFAACGAVKCLDINTEYNALLLEQAIPGYVLKDHHPENIDDTINIYAHTVKSLASRSLSAENHVHVSKWCLAIDRINDQRIDTNFVAKAKQLKSMLLDTAEHEYLCHGDLHLENIIQHGKQWVSIDPKGIVGEMAFEAAAFDLVGKDELHDSDTLTSKLIDRIYKLAEALNIEYKRLLSWIFLRVIISAQWFIEDNGDPSHMLELAKLIYPLFKYRSVNRNTLVSYEKISDWYDQHRPRDLFEKPYLDKVLSHLKPEASILDLGCGTGEPFISYYLEKGYKVTGVDGCQAQLNKAKSRFPNVEFILQDMRTLNLNEKFDGIIAWHSFFHLTKEDQRLMFDIFEKHMNPDGMLIFSSGPEEGEVWSDNGEELLYHASLSSSEYRSLLNTHHFEVTCHEVSNPECGGATIWIARYSPDNNVEKSIIV